MLSNTAYVILAFLSVGPKTGYDIKAKVDQSTRFFWAASYGQIYPELRKLADAGLITGTEKTQGKRARTEYAITPDGHERLIEWLRYPAASCEMRDEGLLKLFFAAELDPADAIAAISAIEADKRRTLTELRTIERVVGDELDPFKSAVLEYGIGLYEHAIGWCESLRAELETQRSSGSTQSPKQSPQHVAG